MKERENRARIMMIMSLARKLMKMMRVMIINMSIKSMQKRVYLKVLAAISLELRARNVLKVNTGTRSSKNIKG